jgi:UDP-N-acetylglucosamine 2-epimerase (non-hydrolysing)
LSIGIYFFGIYHLNIGVWSLAIIVCSLVIGPWLLFKEFIMHKVIFVAGARPNFMKIAPLLREFKKYKDFKCVLVHTGQHYDYEMSESFFQDLQIPKPDYFLGVGSGSHANQTAATMIKFEEVCEKEAPAIVAVVGDVNSTLACSITAKKMNIKVAHIEAGLRSFDLAMPEEINRMVTDSISDFLFTTEKAANVNLLKEGKKKQQILFVGNTMIDSLVYGSNQLKKIDHKSFGVHQLKNELQDYGVVTLHRPSNVDDRTKLRKMVEVLNDISNKLPLVFPVHPRTKKNLETFKISLGKDIHTTSPLGYLEFLYLYSNSRCLITDSGGIQEEATFLKIPCFTLRSNTERPVTVSLGTNVLIGDDFGRLKKLIGQLLRGKVKKGTIPQLWDGKTSQRIAVLMNKILS